MEARVGELDSCVNRFAAAQVNLLNLLLDVRRSSSETKLTFREDPHIDKTHLVSFVDSAMGAGGARERGPGVGRARC